MTKVRQNITSLRVEEFILWLESDRLVSVATIWAIFWNARPWKKQQQHATSKYINTHAGCCIGVCMCVSTRVVSTKKEVVVDVDISDIGAIREGQMAVLAPWVAQLGCKLLTWTLPLISELHHHILFYIWIVEIFHTTSFDIKSKEVIFRSSVSLYPSLSFSLFL